MQAQCAPVGIARVPGPKTASSRDAQNGIAFAEHWGRPLWGSPSHWLSTLNLIAGDNQQIEYAAEVGMDRRLDLRSRNAARSRIAIVWRPQNRRKISTLHVTQT